MILIIISLRKLWRGLRPLPSPPLPFPPLPFSLEGLEVLGETTAASVAFLFLAYSKWGGRHTQRIWRALPEIDRTGSGRAPAIMSVVFTLGVEAPVALLRRFLHVAPSERGVATTRTSDTKMRARGGPGRRALQSASFANTESTVILGANPAFKIQGLNSGAPTL